MKKLIGLIALLSLQSAFALSSISGSVGGRNLSVDDNFQGVTVYVGNKITRFNIDSPFGNQRSGDSRVYDDRNKFDVRFQTGIFTDVMGTLPCGNVNLTLNGSMINGDVCGTSFSGIYFDNKADAIASMREVVLDEIVKGLPRQIQGAVKLKISRKARF